MADRSIPWARVVAESVAIVGSILLAFAIQAWWEGQQERLQAQRDLESVAQELAVNRDIVATHLHLMERLTAGGFTVTELLEASDERSTIEIPDTLAFLVTSTGPTLNPSTGALEALVSSGRIAFVEDRELRRRLSGLGDLFEDAQENQTYVNDLIDDRMHFATVDRFDNAAMIEISMAFFNREETGTLPPDRGLVHRSMLQFPNDTTVRNLIRYWTFSMTSAVREMRTVLNELEELLLLVGAQRGVRIQP